MVRALAGGFVGAAAVTLLHNFLRRYDEAPRLDKLGEEATSKSISALGGDPPKGENLYNASLVGDLISNAVYYSTAAANPRNALISGAGLGVLAGIGAVYVPEQIGLNPNYTAASSSRKWITIGLYTFGGIIAGAVIEKLAKKS